MYDTSDPRAALTRDAVQSTPTDFAAADYLKFYQMPPAVEDARSRSWFGRGQNFLVAYTIAKPGAVLARVAQSDEYAVLLPDAATVIRVEAATQVETISGYRIVFVPPGDSRIEVIEAGQIVRLFSSKAADIAAICANATAYASPQPNTTLLEPWPEPRDGYRIRSYSLDVPQTPGRFGRIFRCTNLMVNVLTPWDGPRDTTKLSPHYHDDFQQGSLALQGEFVHHLRWPWTTDMNKWRHDDHELCGSPSLAIIPPPSIHTTQAIGKGVNMLVDLFSPPRVDFSQKPGWVLNAADYPAPTTP